MAAKCGEIRTGLLRAIAEGWGDDTLCLLSSTEVLLKKNFQCSFYDHLATVDDKYSTAFLCNKTNRRTKFSKFIFVKKLYIFLFVPLPIIRCLFTVHSAMVHRGVEKSLALTGRKQATATEDSEFHITCLRV
jgi:hypothetical protein